MLLNLSNLYSGVKLIKENLLKCGFKISSNSIFLQDKLHRKFDIITELPNLLEVFCHIETSHLFLPSSVPVPVQLD